ncbi:glycerate kinase family protein [Olsenella massiliensis]|uniref:glycerate kinase family protein n=1 Tax=Olsenella massiliensis TaxID=1622075 RepID=UPI00071CE557|nr:glycerate kinase [Olsenella massiliensis]
MLRFLFACDSFKGTISSARSAELLVEEALPFFPDATFSSLEVADGGEGTVDALVSALGGERVRLSVANPLGRSVEACYGLLPGGTAVIETASASGLPLLSLADRNPLITSTYGTGELIADAIARGASDIMLAIGGSATNDCGMGAVRALGVRLLDEKGVELKGMGSDLARVARIDLSGMDKHVAKTNFHVMCDVNNPLIGPRGATHTFGPQKGADPTCVDELEAGMVSYSSILAETFGLDVSTEPGMGAAGGLGAAARLFFNAEIVAGVDCVLDLVGFDEALAGCDLCVTGEGHADSQSAHGKVVSGIAARCRAADVPCVAVVGGMNADAITLFDCGVNALVPTVIDTSSIEDALAAAEDNFRLAAQRMFALLSIGKKLGVTQ